MTLLMADPRTWVELAECRGMDPELFFPTRGERLDEIRAVCAECPVRVECLEYALDNDEHFGIWGGVLEGERHKMRRERRNPDGLSRGALARSTLHAGDGRHDRWTLTDEQAALVAACAETITEDDDPIEMTAWCVAMLAKEKVPGAISRLAEALGVSYATIQHRAGRAS